jgi:hypothetical protein
LVIQDNVSQIYAIPCTNSFGPEPVMNLTFLAQNL